MAVKLASRGRYGANGAPPISGQVLCYTLPPKEIYDVLHLAKSTGIELPGNVMEWWEDEKTERRA